MESPEFTKNIQFPYKSYSGHFCFGIIYYRIDIPFAFYHSLESLQQIPSVIGKFLFFAEEKWRIASDKSGSGNTANIGSIHNIQDIVTGNGVFAKAGEELFDDYWINYGRIETIDKNGNHKKITSFEEYLRYRRLSDDLYNKTTHKKAKRKES